MSHNPPHHPAHITTCISHELKDQLNETRGDNSLSAWVRIILEGWTAENNPPGETTPGSVTGSLDDLATESLDDVLS